MLRRVIGQVRPGSIRFAAAKAEMFLEKLEGDDAGIAVMNFNRPGAMNSISKNMVKLLVESIEECRVSITNRL